jgi:hypothetical protein
VEFQLQYLCAVTTRLQAECRRLEQLLVSSSPPSLELVQAEVADRLDSIAHCLELSQRLYGSIVEIVQPVPGPEEPLVRGLISRYDL